MLHLPREEESTYVSTHLPHEHVLACILGPHLRSPRGLRHVGNRGKDRRGSSESDRSVSRGTVQTLRERHGRVSLLLGVDPDGGDGAAAAASARESSDADRGISSGTVQTLRERRGRVSVLLGLGPDGCGSLDAADPAGAARESSDADRGISSGTVPALRERHGRVSVLLGLGPHGSHRSAASAAAPLKAACGAWEEGHWVDQLYIDKYGNETNVPQWIPGQL